MSNEIFDSNGLSQIGAKKFADLLEGHPYLRNQIGKSTWVDRRHHSTKLTEIHIDDIRKTLQIPESITTGEGVAKLMSNVTTGFSDYGTHTVTIDTSRIEALVQGKDISSVYHR